MRKGGTKKWAEEELGAAQLGDIRRTRRLVKMAASVAERPSGKVAVVFDRMSEREGAYDFLESGDHAASVAESVFRATAKRTNGAARIFVPVDITSLHLKDEGEEKIFGPIGSPNNDARGLMVANAYAVSEDGVPLGLIDQRYWIRGPYATGTIQERTTANTLRPFDEKQGAYFVRAAARSIARLYEGGTTPWLVIDREGDNREILLALRNMPCDFTIRGTKNRTLAAKSDEKHVRESLMLEKPRIKEHVHIGGTRARKERTATIEVRAKKVELLLSATALEEKALLELHAVLVTEVGAGAKRPDALNWLLYTTAAIETPERVAKVVASYRARWRIEEFHRTWKQGHCNVEDARLRSVEAMMTWAVMLAAVATRIERLKYLSREMPNEPATIELDDDEIEALKVEREARYRNRDLTLPEIPTIKEATEWIAEMGGWTGKRAGPPGSITLARGLERLAIYVRAMHDFYDRTKKSGKNARK